MYISFYSLTLTDSILSITAIERAVEDKSENHFISVSDVRGSLKHASKCKDVAQQMVSTAVECRDTGGNPRSIFGCVCVFALVKISISTVWNLAALFELTFGVSTSQEQLLLSHHTTPQAKNGFEKYYLNASR